MGKWVYVIKKCGGGIDDYRECLLCCYGTEEKANYHKNKMQIKWDKYVKEQQLLLEELESHDDSDNDNRWQDIDFDAVYETYVYKVEKIRYIK